MNTAIISVFIANPSVLFGTLILEALPGAALAYGLVWWAMRPKDGRKVPSPFLSHAGGVLVAVTGGAVFRIIAMTTFAGRSAYEPVSETGAAGFYILVVPAIVAYAYIAWLKGRLSNQAKPRTTSNSSENAYAEALAEIEEGQMNKGVWARTFAESGGDESKATALYIKARADATKNPAVWEATQPAIAYDTGITTTVEGGSRPLVPSPIYPLRILAGVAAAGVVAIVVIPAYQDYTKRQMASVTTEIPATDWEKGVMTQPPSEAKPPFKVRTLALRGRIES